MKDTYNGMTGGLFENEPLKLKRDPSRNIRADQIRQSLKSLKRGCAIPEKVWEAVWRKCGKNDTPPDSWRVSVMAQVELVRGTLLEPGSVGYDHTQNEKDYNDGLLSLAKRLMDA